MLSHVFVGISDFERALAFYRPVLSTLGVKERFCEPDRPWAGWESTVSYTHLTLPTTPYV